MKPKYSLEFRLSVVKYYLEGHGDRRTGSKFGVNRNTVSQWVASYEQHGIDGITWKNDRHTPEFKLSIVQIMLKEGLSIREATARFSSRSGHIPLTGIVLRLSTRPLFGCVYAVLQA